MSCCGRQGCACRDAIGHTLSVVGGIVIGDAIVTAGLVGLPMIIIIALTAVSAFAVPSLYEPVTILRFLFIFIGGILGFTGHGCWAFGAGGQPVQPAYFGTPLTAPIAPWRPAPCRDLFWRAAGQRGWGGGLQVSPPRAGKGGDR